MTVGLFANPRDNSVKLIGSEERLRIRETNAQFLLINLGELAIEPIEFSKLLPTEWQCSS
jgi:hypothetical protein